MIPAGDQTVVEGMPLTITNLASIVDPGFINPARSSVETFDYSIDWGDGSPPDLGAATIDQLGSDGNPTLASFDGSHLYANDGLYTVTLTVTDDDGGVGTAELKVNVLNANPTLVVSGNQTTVEGTELSIINIGTVSVPSFSPSEGDQITYSIDWGDGTPLDTGVATIDQFGSAGTPTLASFDGAHTYADNGLYTVTVAIADDDGGTDSGTFTVTVGNVNPTLTVAEDQMVLEGSLLSITNIGSINDPAFRSTPLGNLKEFTYSIDWGDGTPLDTGTATIDQLGSVGNPTLASFDGSHTYADNGLYTVTVSIADDDGGTDSGTFTVTVGNVNPTLTVADDQMVLEGSVLSIANIGAISDPAFRSTPLGNLKEFTYSIDWGDGTPLDTGVATIDQLGSVGTSTLASFDGAHTYADNGVYTVTVSIADDDGGTDSGTFTVTVGNVNPTLTVAEDQMVLEGSLLSITNIGSISDPGFINSLRSTDEKFTYSIDWGDGTPLDAGPATIDVPGSAGTPTAGSFDGSHTYADNGIYTVTLTLSDDDGATVSTTLQVTVNNVAPTLTVPPDQTVNEGRALVVDRHRRFHRPRLRQPAQCGRRNQREVHLRHQLGRRHAARLGARHDRRAWFTRHADAGSFNGSHTYADNGVYTVTVTISDDDGGTD